MIKKIQIYMRIEFLNIWINLIEIKLVKRYAIYTCMSYHRGAVLQVYKIRLINFNSIVSELINLSKT